MAENIAANYGDMDAAVAQFNQQVSQFEQALLQMTRAVENLGATWKGTGYMSFQAVSQRWVTDATNLNNLLADISRQVQTSTGIFQTTDQQIASGFNRL